MAEIARITVLAAERSSLAGFDRRVQLETMPDIYRFWFRDVYNTHLAYVPMEEMTSFAVGGIIWQWNVDHLRISSLYVLRDFQRQGVGTALLDSLLEVCQEKRVKRVYVNAALDARGFYAHCGFVRVPRTTGTMVWEVDLGD